MGACMSCLQHGQIRQSELATKDTPVASPSSSPTATLEVTYLEQPELNPAAWLLTLDEIIKSRGGQLRSDLECFTSGNSVQMFASSDLYFASAFADMEATNSSMSDEQDFIWVAGWSLSLNVPFMPLSSSHSPETTTLAQIIERAVLKRGVQVRVMLWANVQQQKEVAKARDWLNAVAPEAEEEVALSPARTKGSCLCIFDDRLPHHTSSHHQKMIVVKRQNKLIAYVGGLDITHDRWDTLKHDQAQARVDHGIRKETQGWIDAALRLDGHAAKDIAATFISRWNSGNLPCQDLDDRLLKFENPPLFNNLPRLATITRNVDFPDTGKSNVQIVRTFSPDEEILYPEFAPKGELSLLDARVKAIKQARNYVYIEDQYFFFMPQLMDALMEALPRLLRVIVVVQRPTVTAESKVAGYEHLAFQMAKPLISQFPGKFKIYTTKEALGLYIHSKLVIVDDVYVSIGTSNWNRRSMTSDTEIAANIVDDELMTLAPEYGLSIQVSRAVRHFRLQKFSEMTGKSVEELDLLGLEASCDVLDAASQDPSTILDSLAIDLKWEYLLFPPSYTLHIVDPDDLNGDEKQKPLEKH
uniref:phospholipase D n=1 Tax=Globisporangium ultimum (strain ATCC 200006 / CBS 805.95 / DAOM BR144) TaxID=431595 RepID=K3WNR6_GLOUD